jgi:hypothetical protein
MVGQEEGKSSFMLMLPQSAVILSSLGVVVAVDVLANVDSSP